MLPGSCSVGLSTKTPGTRCTPRNGVMSRTLNSVKKFWSTLVRMQGLVLISTKSFLATCSPQRLNCPVTRLKWGGVGFRLTKKQSLQGSRLFRKLLGRVRMPCLGSTRRMGWSYLRRHFVGNVPRLEYHGLPRWLRIRRSVHCGSPSTERRFLLWGSCEIGARQTLCWPS